MTADEFKCEMCGGIFNKGWTDEEAKVEYDSLVKDGTYNGKEETGVLCDNCFRIALGNGTPEDFKLLRERRGLPVIGEGLQPP